MSSNILGSEWNLSPDGINIVTDNGSIKDQKTVLKKALDSDLKATGKSALVNELSKSQIGKIVLQIQKIRNISAPKAKEESQAAPRMLKLTLTDGESYVQAIETSQINSISREKTAPGTKVLISGASVVSGYVLITPQNFTVLGGQVEHLYEKWILAKSVQQNHQSVSNDGAPPWVPFGSRIISGNQDKPFKSLEKNKDGTTNSEFDQQRNEAIAEASTGAVKKTFGGRVKQMVQPSAQGNQQYNKGKGKDNDRGVRKGRFAQKGDEGLEKLQKPSDKVSLFSFLEDKLPVVESKKPNGPSPSCNKNNCQNYHQKDPRIQHRHDSKQNNKQQNDRSSSNYQSNYNESTSKPAHKSSFDANKGLPQAGSTTNVEKSKPSTNVNRHSSVNKNSASGDTTHSSSFRNKYPKEQNINESKNSQQQFQPAQNQYRSNNDKYLQSNQNKNSNDRYSQQTNNQTTQYSRDNYNQQNGYRNNSDRYTQQQYSRDNFNFQQHPQGNAPRQQYSNANNYQQHNNQYSQKPPQNTQPNVQNTEMHQLANNLSKMSVSNEFASRSLRQHLNLGQSKRQDTTESGSALLNVGDQCLAKYWEDGKFYPAVIAAITEKTYAVQFKGYGNIEEVLKHDCFSAANSYNQQNRNNNYNNYQQNNFSGGSMEFESRRGPPRN